MVGWLVCGRCGRRVRAAHGGKAQHVRSTCMRATSAAGGPGCRRLAGAFLERFGAAQGRQGLQPASRALRLAAEQTLRAEREPCAAQWPQRLERAPARAQRAARQDAAVEPAKRLVAREWERRWAEALRHEQPRQEAEARFRRARPLEVPGREREALRRLARAVPAWWQAPETTAQDRQASVRGLVERVTVEVHEASAQVEVPGPGAGGVTRAQRLRRPGARSEQRSHAPDRVAHLAGRRQTGHRCAHCHAAQAPWLCSSEAHRALHRGDRGALVASAWRAWAPPAGPGRGACPAPARVLARRWSPGGAQADGPVPQVATLGRGPQPHGDGGVRPLGPLGRR